MPVLVAAVVTSLKSAGSHLEKIAGKTQMTESRQALSHRDAGEKKKSTNNNSRKRYRLSVNVDWPPETVWEVFSQSRTSLDS